MIDFTARIAQAIARTRAEFALWEVTNVIVSPKVWNEIAAEMRGIRHIPNAHHEADTAGLPITDLQIIGVPVTANKHHHDGFSIERTQTFRFRA
jgi:hypothetical protein